MILSQVSYGFKLIRRGCVIEKGKVSQTLKYYTILVEGCVCCGVQLSTAKNTSKTQQVDNFIIVFFVCSSGPHN